MVNPLKRIFRHLPKPFAIRSGNQRTVDTRFLLLDRSKFFTGLKRENKLDLFESIYQNNAIASGAVSSLTKLINTRIIPRSDDPRIDARLLEIWDHINGHEINEMLIRNALVSGFAVGEFSWDDNTLEMQKVYVPKSRQIRFQTNRQGDIENVVQFGAFPFGSSLPATSRIPPIPAGKFIVVRHDPLDSTDFYARSLFSGAIDQFEAICTILKSQLAVFQRLGEPRFLITVDNEGLTPEQYSARLDETKAVFDNLATGTDMYSSPSTTVQIIGADSFGVKLEAESRLVISMILANIGIPPALLSMNIQSAGSEGHTRQSIIMLQSLLNDLQQTLETAWNSSFWRMVQTLEGMPSPPKMSFHRPRLLETLMVEEGRELQFKNDMNEVVAGIRPLEWLVQKCGAKEAADPEALEAMIEQRRASPQEEDQQAGTDLENTKLTDQLATGNRTL